MISSVALENITDDYLENCHPGTALKLDYLPEFDVTEDQFAKMLGVSRTRLSKILNAEQSVTADVALRLGKLFGQSPELWMRLQCSYDLLKARRQLGNKLDRIQELPISASTM